MKIRMLSFFVALGLAAAGSAQAVCPVCTIAVGSGVGLARYFGVDDLITGVWVGGLLVSVSLWTLDWMKRKGYAFPFERSIVPAAYYAFSILPLYWSHSIGHPLNALFGIDKLVVGIVLGSIAFLLAAEGYQALKAGNGGHAHFPFQKVAMPVAALALVSGALYFLIR